jgi:hypothetical protein
MLQGRVYSNITFNLYISLMKMENYLSKHMSSAYLC